MRPPSISDPLNWGDYKVNKVVDNHDQLLKQGLITPKIWAWNEQLASPWLMLCEVVDRLRHFLSDESVIESAAAEYAVLRRPCACGVC